MHRMISVLFVAMFAIAGSAAFAPRSEASPLIPAAPLARAVAGDNDAVTLAHYYGRYHHRHYGWYHRHHYGWYHRPYYHHYRHYGYYHPYRHYGYYHRYRYY